LYIYFSLIAAQLPTTEFICYESTIFFLLLLLIQSCDAFINEKTLNYGI
jgi:hypothetical protein